MKFSIEAQAEGLYVFNLNANLESNTYDQSQEVHGFLQKCKQLNKDTSILCRVLIKQYKQLEESYVEFGDAVVLSYARYILLFKITTIYSQLLQDSELMENLK